MIVVDVLHQTASVPTGKTYIGRGVEHSDSLLYDTAYL